MSPTSRKIKASPSAQEALARKKKKGKDDPNAPGMWRALAASTQPHGFDGQVPIFAEPRGRSEQEKKSGLVVKNVATDIIEWLYANNFMKPHQHAAANRLKRDMRLSDIANWSQSQWADGPRGQADYSRMGTLSDAKLDAEHRAYQAMRHVGPTGREFLKLLIDGNWGARRCAEEMGHDGRAGGLAMQIALDSLASFYHLA